MEQIKKYFKGDELAATLWYNKYRFGNEQTPEDSFKRHQKEIIEKGLIRLNQIKPKDLEKLSSSGRFLFSMFLSDENKFKDLVAEHVNFKHIVLAGSMQQGIGNHELYSSLSNCFVLGQPHDSYGGINYKENESTQVMKRRGGAGIDLSSIRPRGAAVHNQAKVSTGVVLFAEGYSNKTIQVAQDGRRGALMLSLSILHPDNLDFITVKQDESKITGANLSVKIPDEFMEAVVNDTDILLRFPVDGKVAGNYEELEYNKLYEIDRSLPSEKDKAQYVKRVKAQHIWKTLIHCAWKKAEPGILFEGNWEKHGLDYSYEEYRPISTNPCSEIPMQAYDACRLLAVNLLSLIIDKFTENSRLDVDLAYELFYFQLFIGDLLVDLEIDYIDRIINKIKNSDDPEELKITEIGIWEKIKATCLAGRRIGAGFMGLGDMLAALNKAYVSPEIIEKLFKIKLKAELDATTDLAVLFGTFDRFSPSKEGDYFHKFIKKNFPDEYKRMCQHGRRNISWSTGAPTGTTALMSQITSGIEPLFLPVHKRRTKIIDQTTTSYDFVDADGEKFKEYFVFHPQFKFYLEDKGINTSELTEAQIEKEYKKSPWYKSCANDIHWKDRVKIQSIVQHYTTHAISSTINLPEDIKESVVGDIYLESWKKGLKGNTVYRDGSRAGILVSSSKKKKPKRPRILEGHYHTIKNGKKQYSIIIGFLDNKPYELFIVSGLDNLPEIIDFNEHMKGFVVKDSPDWYNFVSDTFTLREISDMENDEKLISLTLSYMLRKGAKIETISKLINKTKPFAGSFNYKLIKILSKYISDTVSGENCPICKTKYRFENGCFICPECGNSKC